MEVRLLNTEGLTQDKDAYLGVISFNLIRLASKNVGMPTYLCASWNMLCVKNSCEVAMQIVILIDVLR